MKVNSSAMLDILKEIESLSIKEVEIRPNEGGIDIYGMDPSMVSIVNARMKPDAFPEGCTLEENVVLSIPFMLDALIKDEICDMSFNDGKITLKYKKSKRSHRLIMPEEDTPRPVPSIELNDTCVVMSDDIVSLMKMSCFSSITTDTGGITVRLTENGMIFEATSAVESAEVTVEGTTVLEEGEIKALFGMKVISPVLKALPKGIIVTVSMGDSMPIKISVDEDAYSMDIFVAPFLMEDDE